jgi:hypothetical protein
MDDRVESTLDDVFGLELGQPDFLRDLLDNLFLGHDGNLLGSSRPSPIIDWLNLIGGMD